MLNNHLQLFVNENSPASIAAIATMRSICRDYFHNDCYLEIIDITKEPQKMENSGIVAIPTLIRLVPRPAIRLIGALSMRSRVLRGLGIVNDGRETNMAIAN